MATARELGEVELANTSGRQVVVFVHGLWLLAGSWHPWREKFEAAGYATIAPGWPDDPETVAEGRANPDSFAGKSVGAITEYYVDLISRLDRKPVIIGHSFGGLITQKLAGMGLAKASVPIDPAPGRGVLPLPLSALRSALPALRNPANRKKAVMLTYAQFRFAFVRAHGTVWSRLPERNFIGPRLGFARSTRVSLFGLKFATAAWNSGNPAPGTGNSSYSRRASSSGTAFTNANRNCA